MSKKLVRIRTVLFIITMITQLFVFPDKAFESVSASWERCIASLLPSLFPMSVLSKQICPYLFFKKNFFSSALSKISGFSERELPVFLISLFCGYPIPAITVKDIVGSGVLTKEEAKKIVNLCNNASPSFLIFFVGRCVLGSQFLGFLIYVCQTLAVSVCAHFIKSQNHEVPAQKTLHESLSESVVRSAKSIVVLFGFVIFFSLCADLAGNIAIQLDASNILCIFISGIFEPTCAVSGINSLPFLAKPLFACLFSSFGGLSVFFQIKASAGNELVNTREYFTARLAVFCGSLLFLIPLIFLTKSTLL